jgi:hypothetical protein
MDTKTKEITKAYDAAHQLNRIASALEEILRLVKKDMEPRTKKEKADEGNFADGR